MTRIVVKASGQSVQCGAAVVQVMAAVLLHVVTCKGGTAATWLLDLVLMTSPRTACTRLPLRWEQERSVGLQVGPFSRTPTGTTRQPRNISDDGFNSSADEAVLQHILTVVTIQPPVLDHGQQWMGTARQQTEITRLSTITGTNQCGEDHLCCVIELFEV